MEVQRSLVTQNVIAYIRKSQEKRGQRHSLQAQQDGISSFCNSNNLHVVEWYQDIASGKNDNRSGLLEAIEHAKKINAPLVVLRVDRLSRRLSTLATYFEDASLRIYVAELGMSADFMTLSMMAVMAAQEAKLISRRTKEGLRAAAARGVKLGNPNPSASLAKCRAYHEAKGQATVEKYGGLIVQLREQDKLSYDGIAMKLTELEIPTPSGRGYRWNPRTVGKIYKRVIGF